MAEPTATPLMPSIGVVGGGQLAWMLAAAAQQLHVHLHVQTPGAHDPATSLATSVVQADLDDIAATRELARRCSAITFENEWVDLPALAPLSFDGITFLPSLEALSPLVSKRSQRELLQQLGLPAPRWCDLPSDGVLPDGFSYPLMAKASTGGYDGKGTAVLQGPEDLQALLARIPASDWILEELVSFELELSQLACRDRAGNLQCYPLVQTHQHQQVCDWVLAPASVPHAVQAYARNIAASLLTAINYVGVLSIEFFYGQGGLQVNEIAPRTHNSGHFTIEAAHTSQFAQQVRIVAGLPMGPVELQVPGALMVNLLGFESSDADYQSQRDALAALPQATVHWYGKQGSSPGRKLGHVTLLLEGTTPQERDDQAQHLLEQVRLIWPLPPAVAPSAMAQSPAESG
ncbi:5-(carboxyamino)imidazole ribonucleotide synthase [Cyanobium sp. Aljojuca 7D2]|uniref:5-(carboxyamino)imidazole ribonucleotide synthase n=1 Tax=Cyanobium sp. Aljojuca 7D2 TaxID=2823698 RepID=UPI0020CDBCEE|nr:5-(carboxyamino)imidazole ribonucleotide synthase [Cyanobium sp. Aljojuca 7D2]MCP9889534.1 5-(carboxyamino)imidazole ribonucleotide synthase [Cyanobium sp. Aljojuca 7D2]